MLVAVVPPQSVLLAGFVMPQNKHVEHMRCSGFKLSSSYGVAFCGMLLFSALVCATA